MAIIPAKLGGKFDRSFVSCSQVVYENILGEIKEEIEADARAFGKEPPKLTRDELEQEFPYDWPVIEKDTRKLSLSRCEDTEKGRDALKILKLYHPDRYEHVKGRCWVGPKDRVLGGRGHSAEHVAMRTKEGWYSNIYVQGPHFDLFSPEELAQTYDHEGIHIDALENPERYGIKKERTEVVHRYPELFLEHLIEEREKQSPLYRFAESKRKKMSKIYFGSKRVVWAYEPMLLIHTCMTGRKITPRGIE